MGTYKKLILGFVAAVVILASSGASHAQGNWQAGDAGVLRFRLGLFQPRADSTYWDEVFEVWTGEAEDFQNLAVGVDGIWMLSGTSGLQLGTEWYDGDSQQSYREWVDDAGNAISHWTELRTWEMTVAWVYRPRTRSVVRPYFGIGGGFSWWRLTESGQFIDFGSADPGVFSTTYQDEGTALIGIAEIGIDVFAWDVWSFFVEGRWKQGDASLGGSFGDLQQRLDLSGLELSAGFALHF